MNLRGVPRVSIFFVETRLARAAGQREPAPLESNTLILQESVYKGAKKAIFPLFFYDFLGRRGGRASGRLDHGLKTLQGGCASSRLDHGFPAGRTAVNTPGCTHAART